MKILKVLFAAMFIISIGACNKETKVNEQKENSSSTVKTPESTPPIFSLQSAPSNTTLPPPNCFVGTINSSIDAQNSAYNGFSLLNSSSLYNFKDNFLSTGTKGEAYKAYYYRISDFILNHGLLDVSLSDIYNLMRMAETVSSLATGSGNDVQVIVTDDIYDFCKAMSVKVHNNSNFSEVSDIFTVLDADLEYLHGKTQSQFDAFFH